MLEETVKVDFHPHPTQRRFIRCKQPAALFSGRMREGKTTAIVWSIFDYALQNPTVDQLMVRDTFDSLERTTLQEFLFWFKDMGEMKLSKKRFDWKVGDIRSSMHLLGIDDPKDMTKLQSLQYGLAAMDEIGPSVDVNSGGIPEDAFDFIFTRFSPKAAKWYGIRCAENNPDESHWSYRRFVDPGSDGFIVFQPPEPENEENIRAGYYDDLDKNLAHRPDLLRRFGRSGKFGFTQVGKPVVKNWNEHLHLAERLRFVKGRDLVLCWDGGFNPTCIVTQIGAGGHWNILWAVVGEGCGVLELIEDEVIPIMDSLFRGHGRLVHYGDLSMVTADQSTKYHSPVKTIIQKLGGRWHSGPKEVFHRIEGIEYALRRVANGTGMMKVDKTYAKPVWHALRGGWHHKPTKGGHIGEIEKDLHSHPGDAIGYGASMLFKNSIKKSKQGYKEHRPTYDNSAHYETDVNRHFRRGPHPQHSAPSVLIGGPVNQ